MKLYQTSPHYLIVPCKLHWGGGGEEFNGRRPYECMGVLDWQTSAVQTSTVVTELLVLNSDPTTNMLVVPCMRPASFVSASCCSAVPRPNASGLMERAKHGEHPSRRIRMPENSKRATSGRLSVASSISSQLHTHPRRGEKLI
jgi:hypothetical protein